ncbi:flavodoxin domain-containing protein [Georgenia sp. EYE_87]|uniref:flavodoxin family protein n=1 Tax=Georgenia sp. EYE_87 TaxID=2853448 RepID=UPI002004DB91|nr:flavodoxin domain-containing protein [Georgenia sp. EYE_87]MCK6210630.1 flavodoxin domain-containing protein [Georgenia sp. EYE_87]
MHVAYYHASRFGNGAAVAAKFAEIMAARGVTVDVRHMRDADPKRLPPADLYVFSTPGFMGKPRRTARSFAKHARLQPGTRYAILTTEVAPRPDKNGQLPDPEKLDRWQRVMPIMRELLEGKGVEVAEGTVRVTDLKGPLEEGWEEKVRAFADRISSIQSSAA